ncbi:MAG: hypothetical protein V3V01_03860 [Acidimicrobiales bacterium]
MTRRWLKLRCVWQPRPAAATLPGVIFHSDRGGEGGFDRSSQHLDVEVCDGEASGMDDRVDGAVPDEIAWSAVASA